MPTDSPTVAGAGSPCKGDSTEQEAWNDWSPSTDYLRARARDQFSALLDFSQGCRCGAYEDFERRLIPEVFRLGRLLITLFLCAWEEREDVGTREVRGQQTYRRQPPKGRWLGTFFGRVRYWRTYLQQTNGAGGGFYPLDTRLGLLADGFSMGVLARAVRLATQMSYSAAALVFSRFLGWSPSHKSIEKATLGLGSHTATWVKQRPAPTDDGEVLVVQFDSKATPTAREQELALRRGPRRASTFPGSPRHRARLCRSQRSSPPRRKKGDKSKNGKATTVVVMYTLRAEINDTGERYLAGPLNRWVYASFAPKRHAFAIAHREAEKRGFAASSGKRVQVMTDGDTDLARYTAEFFPKAIHSLDVIHATEYLWRAGACLYKEGSAALEQWVEAKKENLYEGKAEAMVSGIRGDQRKAPSKDKRERLEEIARYFEKRLPMMNYDELAAEDLELSSGAVEGAVRYVVSQRFDEGGMRWIRQRAEALLQLRCIEINGDWDDFVSSTHRRICRQQRQSRHQTRLLQGAPETLPTFGINQ
jgi:hypothetical protein